MTRRHFEALAAALRESRPDHSDTRDSHPLRSWADAVFGQWLADVRAVISVCQDANKRFDSERFWAAVMDSE